MGYRPDRRAWSLIDRKFQYGLAFRLFIASALLSLAGLVLVFAPSVYHLGAATDPEILEKAAEEFLLLHKRVWPAVLLCFAGVFIYCIILSRRIAGPICRINAVLEQLLQDKRPGKVTFRKNDWFHPTASLLERLSSKLHGPPREREENGRP